MKKQLMAGTALVAAAMLAAGGALAADKKMMKPSISVNGYYEGVIGGIIDEEQKSGGVDAAKDTPALDVRTDAEIHFNGRTTLDSGMKIHARVELEGQSHHSIAAHAGDPIDEYFISVSGSFGQIILGGTGGAPVKMLTGLSGSWATSVGETLSFDNEWVPSVMSNVTHHYNLKHSRLDTGDAEKVTYISPKFGGFQVGLTYSPDRTNDDTNSRINAESEAHDGLEGAVSYSNKFGDVGFGVGAGMTAYQGANKSTVTCDIGAVKLSVDDTTTADDLVSQAAAACTANSTDDLSDWLVAARLDFGGGFRVAIAHKRVTNDNKAQESQLTDAGVRFVTGANSFSLVGSHAEMDQGGASFTAVMGSYARSMGPGVKAHVNLLWNESDNGMSGEAAKENTGTALITGIKVVF